jgi:hypothetical protein
MLAEVATKIKEITAQIRKKLLDRHNKNDKTAI